MEEVLNHISTELTEVDLKKLLKNLGLADDIQKKDILDKLEDVPWFDLKRELEIIDKGDIVTYIQRNTLITKGNDRFHKNGFSFSLLNINTSRNFGFVYSSRQMVTSLTLDDVIML